MTVIPTFTAAPPATLTPAQPTSTVTPAYVAQPATQKISSPDGRFYIVAASTGTRLYRAGDDRGISQLPAGLAPAEDDIVWAPNSLEAIVSDAQYTYLLTVDGQPPREVPAPGLLEITWSDDASRLIAAENQPGQTATDFVLVDATGRLQHLGDGGQEHGVDLIQFQWLTSSLVEAIAGYGSSCGVSLYFNVASATTYPPSFNCFDLSEPDSLSPDRIWRVADSADRVWEGEPYASGQHYEHSYDLLNFQTGQDQHLYSGANQYLDWVGWTPDGTMFYFVNRPASATALAGSDLPFGLIALNPNTRGIQVVFAQAVYARLSADQTLACAVFPAKRADGKLGLDASVFNLAANTMTSRQAVSDELDYPLQTSGDWAPRNWLDATQNGCGDK